jgi:acetyl-CoA C-acetyltransferase
VRSELGQFPGRDPVNPKGGQDCAADVYKQAGITDPIRDVDVLECYVPFSWYEPMWMENLGYALEGTGWKLTEDGDTDVGGAIPTNVSGGVLSSNPIGASGMLRFLEAALQVRGMAGAHQIDGARTAVGHAYGGAAQFFAMWVVRDTKP